MDLLNTFFPISGVSTPVFIPPLVAFVISSFTAMAGVSGAFILLPFQMSFLGFTSPAVTSTNFVYNIFAIPSGVYRYFREGRMFWPLAWVLIAGTLPGVFLGYYLRVLYLPDPRLFKVFVGIVLLYVGGRLLADVLRRNDRSRPPSPRPAIEGASSLRNTVLPSDAVVHTLSFTAARVAFEFLGERYRFSVPAMFFLALAVGIIGGTYGIGGGAIIAPFCVAVFHLPVYTVAGAALLGTFLTSIVGVIFYSVLPAVNGMSTAPDWALGFLFGIGGFAGMYVGARLQKYFRQNTIKTLLGGMILFVALRYISQFFS